MSDLLKIFTYSIWEIVIPEENPPPSKMDVLSRWACKYCFKNNTDTLKHYITDSSPAAVYCWILGEDEQVSKFVDQDKWKEYKDSELSFVVDRALVIDY